MISEERLQEIRERCQSATQGPWYTVESPWRASYYNKETGLNEPIGTYVVAGSPDPHVGTPILDSIEIDEWEVPEDGSYCGPDYSQSDADLNFAAHARTDIPDLLAEVERLKQQITSAPFRPASTRR